MLVELSPENVSDGSRFNQIIRSQQKSHLGTHQADDEQPRLSGTKEVKNLLW